MLDKLPSSVLVWCIVRYLYDNEKRKLSATCKMMYKIVEKYCMLNQDSIEDLCREARLMIIYKRNLMINNTKTFYQSCELGYAKLVEKSVLNFGVDQIEIGLDLACRSRRRKTIWLLVLALDDQTMIKKIDEDHEFIDLLIKVSKDNYEDNRNLNYCLIRACKEGHDGIARLMFKKGAKKLNAGLISACQREHINIVKWMIGVLDVYRYAEDWNYGLWIACLKGYREIVDLLVSLLDGAVPEGVADWDEGLAGACEGGHLDIVNLMIEKGARDLTCSFLIACDWNYYEIIELMISKRKLYVDIDWGAILHNACYRGRHEIVRLLIRTLGNDLSIIWDRGLSIIWDRGLSGACEGERRDLIDLMIKKGASFCLHCHKTMKEHL